MPKTITAEEFGGFIEGVVGAIEKPQAKEVFEKWNDELAGELSSSFLDSKSPDGVPWAPLKQQRPKGHNQGERPLIDTGDLMRSVVSDGPGHIEIVTQDSTTFGTSMSYAAVQQYGNKPEAKNNIPPRPFIGIPEKSLDSAIEMLSDHIIKSIDGI